MKYLIAIVATAVIVFIGTFIYFRGLPSFISSNSTPIPTESTVPPASPTPSPVADETSVLIAAIKAALIAEHGANAGLLTITVSKTEGNYAKGGSSGQGGGGLWFAAKVNGEWKLVYDGNGIIKCSDVAPYPEFPVDMIPSCWDTTTNELVNR